MINKFRRKFLVSISLSAFSLPVFSKTTSFLMSESLGDKAKEFLGVYRIWLETMNIEPEDYLLNKGIKELNNKSIIKEASVGDFNAGATININGYVLSLTEAAVVAAVGRNFLGGLWSI